MPKTILSILLLLLSLPSVAAASEAYLAIDCLKKLPTSSLLSTGRKFYDESPDSAMIYYTILSGIYSQGMKTSEKEDCLAGTLEKWEIAFFSYFDYQTCFDTLYKAKEISNDLGRDEPRIDLYYGCMYHTIYEQTKDPGVGEKAYSCFTKALDGALHSPDITASRIAFGNLIEIAHSLGRLENIEPTIANYTSIATKRKWPGLSYDLGLYKALALADKGNYAESIAIYKDLIKEAETNGHDRYKYAAMTGVISGYKDSGNYKEALRWIGITDSTFRNNDMRDGRMMLYRIKTECLDSLGMGQLARESMADYVMLKDSLLNYTQISAINNSEFIDEIKGYEKRLFEIRQKKKLFYFFSLASMLIVAVITFSWLKLHRKNKALDYANRTLYQKNVELLNNERRDNCMNDHNGQQKYKNSVVSETLRNTVWENIQSVMSGNKEILDADFSIDRLAELCGSKTKYVSQIINEKGENFKTLLNTYRIKEACRIMVPTSNLTIEAIANEVGFKSVNSFRTAFRRVTGLSPSDYLKIAREKGS